MKRSIITIDEKRCNGCGNCVTACSEGALAIIDGVARVTREDFCDGLGNCIGDCPTGALKIEQREAPAFDPVKMAEHAQQSRGGAPFGTAHRAAPHGHHHQGCPSAASRVLRSESSAPALPVESASERMLPSDLGQWPVMLHLVSPHAPYFSGRELVVMSTCSPVATPEVHPRFMRGRGVVIACPKLDDTSGYVEKLTAILAHHAIRRVVVVTMEVPCCAGLCAIVREAVAALPAGAARPIVDECVIGLDGAYQGSRRSL